MRDIIYMIAVMVALWSIMKGCEYRAQREKATEVQRVEAICFGGTFIDGECKAGSVPSLQSFQSERKPIRSSLETARMDREASRGDGVGQSSANSKTTDSKAVQEGGVSRQGHSAYTLCTVSYGESAGNDSDKSLSALFPEDVEDVEARRVARCRSYRIADNDK